MQSRPAPTSSAPLAAYELAAGLLLTRGCAAGAAAVLGLPAGVQFAAVLVYLGMAGLVLRAWPRLQQSLGAANRVTLLRGCLVAIIAGAAWFPDALAANALPLAILSTAALALDGLDGWVARRSNSTSAFGARFDMELDAFFILALSFAVWQLDKAGAWVLAIGAMRYVFVLAMHPLPWLGAALPDSFRRKVVCVWQVGSLLVCLLPAVSATAATAILLVSLTTLSISFALDIGWLFQHARRSGASPQS
ncbi:MAG: CDP-alcohol phosphatidyltransferase [Azoarcus sp.]|nr:MAG: CDP-alcohol phosphatidyltransferase [Azoarcus sp.]